MKNVYNDFAEKNFMAPWNFLKGENAISITKITYKIHPIHIGDPVFFQLHIPLHSFDAMLLLEHNRQSIIIQLSFPVENFTKVWNTSGPQRLDSCGFG